MAVLASVLRSALSPMTASREAIGERLALEAVLRGEMEGLGVEARLDRWWVGRPGESVSAKSGSKAVERVCERSLPQIHYCLGFALAVYVGDVLLDCGSLRRAVAGVAMAAWALCCR